MNRKGCILIALSPGQTAGYECDAVSKWVEGECIVRVLVENVGERGATERNCKEGIRSVRSGLQRRDADSVRQFALDEVRLVKGVDVVPSILDERSRWDVETEVAWALVHRQRSRSSGGIHSGVYRNGEVRLKGKRSISGLIDTDKGLSLTTPATTMPYPEEGPDVIMLLLATIPPRLE